MPFGKFLERFQEEPTLQEVFEHLTSSEATIDPDLSEEEIMGLVSKGEKIKFAWIGSKIFITKAAHEDLSKRIHAKDKDVLLKGEFAVDKDGVIEFKYLPKDNPPNKYARNVVIQDKIMSFLRGKGIEVDGFKSFKTKNEKQAELLPVGANPNFDYKKVQSVLEAGGSIYFYLMADSRVFFSDKRKIVLEDITGGKGEQINKMAPGGSLTIGKSRLLHIAYDTPFTRSDQTEVLKASTKATIKKFLTDQNIEFK